MALAGSFAPALENTSLASLPSFWPSLASLFGEPGAGTFWGSGPAGAMPGESNAPKVNSPRVAARVPRVPKLRKVPNVRDDARGKLRVMAAPIGESLVVATGGGD